MKDAPLKRLLGLFYQKLFLINDTPQKISLGLGLGVFTGILPGTGPVAALFLALILRVNRAAAVIGSALTNTWLSFATFAAAAKIGSSILKVSWNDLESAWRSFIAEFSWKALFELSAIKTILPLLVGYLVIALACGLAAYILTLAAILLYRNKR